MNSTDRCLAFVISWVPDSPKKIQDIKLDEPTPFITVEILENHLITEFTCVLSQRQLLDNKMLSHL